MKKKLANIDHTKDGETPDLNRDTVYFDSELVAAIHAQQERKRKKTEPRKLEDLVDSSKTVALDPEEIADLKKLSREAREENARREEEGLDPEASDESIQQMMEDLGAETISLRLDDDLVSEEGEDVGGAYGDTVYLKLPLDMLLETNAGKKVAKLGYTKTEDFVTWDNGDKPIGVIGKDVKFAQVADSADIQGFVLGGHSHVGEHAKVGDESIVFQSHVGENSVVGVGMMLNECYLPDGVKFLPDAKGRTFEARKAVIVPGIPAKQLPRYEAEMSTMDVHHSIVKKLCTLKDVRDPKAVLDVFDKLQKKLGNEGVSMLEVHNTLVDILRETKEKRQPKLVTEILKGLAQKISQERAQRGKGKNMDPEGEHQPKGKPAARRQQDLE